MSHVVPPSPHRVDERPRRRGIRLLATALASLLATVGMLAGAAAPTSAAEPAPDRFGVPEVIDVVSGAATEVMLFPDDGGWGARLFDYPLPPGLELSHRWNGTYLWGTGSPAGTYTVRITGFRNATFEVVQYNVPVRAAAPVAWTAATLPAAEVGTPLDLRLSDVREWETFSTTGTLPPGLTLTADGRLTGTPTAYGTFSFTVAATRTTVSTQRTFELRVTQGAAPVWSSGALPRLQVGVPASISLPVSDTTGVSVVAGALPAGLSISGTTLTGTPTTAAPYEFTLAADGPGGTTNQAFSGFVRLPAVTWVTPSVLSFPRGVPVDVRLEATNATEFDVWAGELPAGLELDPDGRLHGTPTTAGVADVAIVGGHRDGSSTRRFQIAVTVPIVGLLGDDWLDFDWPADVPQADASGLAPNSPWSLTLFPSGTPVASGLAGADGIAVVDEDLEVDVMLGAYELRFTATAADGTPVTDSIWFSVDEHGELLEVSLTGPVAEPQRAAPSADPASEREPATAGAPRALPATGAEPQPWFALSLLLLAAGVAARCMATATSRRRFGD